MPCLSGQFDPTVGVLLQIGILPPGTTPAVAAGGATLTQFPALLDTGASDTCIAPVIARALALPPIGMLSMSSDGHFAFAL
jgi:hypothetical protein